MRKMSSKDKNNSAENILKALSYAPQSFKNCPRLGGVEDNKTTSFRVGSGTA